MQTWLGGKGLTPPALCALADEAAKLAPSTTINRIITLENISGLHRERARHRLAAQRLCNPVADYTVNVSTQRHSRQYSHILNSRRTSQRSVDASRIGDSVARARCCRKSLSVYGEPTRKHDSIGGGTPKGEVARGSATALTKRATGFATGRASHTTLAGSVARIQFPTGQATIGGRPVESPAEHRTYVRQFSAICSFRCFTRAGALSLAIATDWAL